MSTSAKTHTYFTRWKRPQRLYRIDAFPYAAQVYGLRTSLMKYMAVATKRHWRWKLLFNYIIHVRMSMLDARCREQWCAHSHARWTMVCVCVCECLRLRDAASDHSTIIEWLQQSNRMRRNGILNMQLQWVAVVKGCRFSFQRFHGSTCERERNRKAYRAMQLLMHYHRTFAERDIFGNYYRHTFLVSLPSPSFAPLSLWQLNCRIVNNTKCK